MKGDWLLFKEYNFYSVSIMFRSNFLVVVLVELLFRIVILILLSKAKFLNISSMCPNILDYRLLLIIYTKYCPLNPIFLILILLLLPPFQSLNLKLTLQFPVLILNTGKLIIDSIDLIIVVLSKLISLLRP